MRTHPYGNSRTTGPTHHRAGHRHHRVQRFVEAVASRRTATILVTWAGLGLATYYVYQTLSRRAPSLPPQMHALVEHFAQHDLYIEPYVVSHGSAEVRVVAGFRVSGSHHSISIFLCHSSDAAGRHLTGLHGEESSHSATRNGSLILLLPRVEGDPVTQRLADSFAAFNAG